MSRQNSIRPTTSGLHVISATTKRFSGETFVTETTLIIDPAELDQLDLILTDHAINAGDSTFYSIEAADKYGNEIVDANPTLDWGNALTVNETEISELHLDCIRSQSMPKPPMGIH